eukprot:CAMPEP_0185729210 /NCGR_PEP_ID=MMETSP1171-20130828/4590_1 /TAXON_ID=374046 /ORGANISM="Helicotheca tamensis, Strain CCMP826" /LENGTH=216 /DNA_ID=CAMNT_0028397997 /DNA_START=38 /DNA_END=688 /DNA_ORIENTATION=+
MLSRAVTSIALRRGIASCSTNFTQTSSVLSNSSRTSNNNNHFSAAQTSSRRSFSAPSVEETLASDAYAASCYVEIDYTINDESSVYDCVERFSAFNVGCLVTTDNDGNITGIVSERDYVNKIALLGRKSSETKVKEISTKASNLVTASPKDSVDACMYKMLSKDVRHLPLLEDESGKVVGMLSIKDLVKAAVAEKEKTIKILSDFALGKGGHFGSE